MVNRSPVVSAVCVLSVVGLLAGAALADEGTPATPEAEASSVRAAAPPAELGPGDSVPNLEKISLRRLRAYEEGGEPPDVAAAGLLAPGHPVVLHFTSVGVGVDAQGVPQLPQEVAALAKSIALLPYPVRAVVVLCDGQDMAERGVQLVASYSGALTDQCVLVYDPGWPRPGLYRLFRPGTVFGEEGDRGLVLPMTYILAEGKVVAVRRPNEGRLVDWVRKHMPERLSREVLQPTASLSTPAADPDTWPCFLRTPEHRAVLPWTETPGRLAPAWMAEVGPSLCSPCVVNGLAFCPGERGMSVVDLATGAVNESTPRRQFGSRGFYWSSPCAAGDVVFCGTTQGELVAMAAEPLRVLRSVRLGGEITSSPVVVNGRVFVGNHDGSLCAVDAETMTVLWRFPTGGPMVSSVAVWGDCVIFGSADHYVYAVRQDDGTEVWSFCTDGPVDASPAVEGGRVYIGSFGGTLYCLDAATGRCLAAQQLGGWLHSSPAVSDRQVYVGSRAGTLYRLEARDLRVQDQWQAPDAFYGSPTVWGDWVMIGCRDGFFRGFQRDNLAAGPVWQLSSGGKMHSNPVVVGDHVLMTSTDGYLRCYGVRPPLPAWGAGQEVGGTRALAVGDLALEMAWVPAGRLTVGMTPQQIQAVWQQQDWDPEDREMMDDAQPAHEVELDGFWIGVTEVTNAQWRAFLQESGYAWEGEVIGEDDFPVVNVSWQDAQAFCNWYGLRLPTEAEWEYAARGPEGRLFPWGDELTAEDANYDATGEREDEPATYLQPVGSYEAGRSWCGALDMAGNVSEWCADAYAKDYYPRSPGKNPPGPAEAGNQRCRRGGDWYRLGMVCLSACRDVEDPAARSNLDGFRVTRNP